MVSGTFPVRRLWLKSRTLRFLRRDVAGKPPVKLFRERVISCRLTKPEIRFGIEPWNPFPVRTSLLSFVKLPIKTAMSPEREGFSMKTSSSRSEPKSSGMVSGSEAGAPVKHL